LGDASSFVGLGITYLYGKGVNKEYAIALHYFNKSAISDNAEGLYYYGYLFLNGKGVYQNFKNAYNLFLSSASKGNILANYQLGDMNLK
jgi:TPR repeat protein